MNEITKTQDLVFDAAQELAALKVKLAEGEVVAANFLTAFDPNVLKAKIPAVVRMAIPDIPPEIMVKVLAVAADSFTTSKKLLRIIESQENRIDFQCQQIAELDDDLRKLESLRSAAQ